MKIIDCFPFFNEEEHLIFRIKFLQNHVNKFVICEADRTHSGIKKEFKCAEILKKHNLLSDKILIVYVQPENLDNWGRERAQRNAAAQLIQDDEVWFISDCDEIINPFYLKTLAQTAIDNPDYIVRAPLIFNSTRADLYVCHPNGNRIKWDIPFFCLKKHIEKHTLSDIREAETLQKEISFKSLIVSDDTVGWHLSWMGNSNRRVQKLESFMHANDVVSSGVGLLSTNEAKEYVRNFNPEENKNDVLGRTDHILKPYPIEKLPQLILNDSKLKEFFLPSKHMYNIIQIGANKGNDDLSQLIGNVQPQKLILVEPMKLHNQDLLNHYSWVNNIFLENVVVEKETGKDVEFFYHVEDGPKYEVASLIREHIYPRHPNLSDEGITSFIIQTININDLFKKYNLLNIDILFIDAEGYDDTIISTIDFEKYNITKLYFENLHIKNQNIYDYLENKGYSIEKNVGLYGWTSLAVKKTFTNFTFTDEDLKNKMIDRTYIKNYE